MNAVQRLRNGLVARAVLGAVGVYGLFQILAGSGFDSYPEAIFMVVTVILAATLGAFICSIFLPWPLRGSARRAIVAKHAHIGRLHALKESVTDFYPALAETARFTIVVALKEHKTGDEMMKELLAAGDSRKESWEDAQARIRFFYELRNSIRENTCDRVTEEVANFALEKNAEIAKRQVSKRLNDIETDITKARAEIAQLDAYLHPSS